VKYLTEMDRLLVQSRIQDGDSLGAKKKPKSWEGEHDAMGRDCFSVPSLVCPSQIRQINC